jgi:predicted ferric reductase
MQRSIRVRPAVPPIPRTWPIHPAEIWVVVVANAVVVTGMWVRHGGMNQIGTAAGVYTAAGQITALLGTYLALVGLVLMSRSPWLDQLFGADGLARWHRWVGFGTLWLLVGHTLFTTVGYAAQARSSLLDEAIALLSTYPYVLMATVALVLLVAVGVASVKAARRRLSYETWYGIHLYAYLAVALAFLHELAVGTDFVDDTLAQAYWVGLYVVVVVLIVVFRIWQPIMLSARHRFRVANVVQEGPGVVSVYIAGRHLEQLPVRAGQFFLWRFLAGGGWWRAHPYSISTAPNGEYLRITIKDSGDDSQLFQRLPVGTRVFAEGPYGAFTGARRRRKRVLLIAGGIGITPLRALLEEFPTQPGAVTVLYRASSWDDVVFHEELDALAQMRGARIHYLVGRRRPDPRTIDPLDARSILRMVPDVDERDVFICGPDPMIDAVKRGLRSLHVPNSQIHAERFAY